MRYITIFIILFTLLGCGKDDSAFTGEVSFTFVNLGITKTDEIRPKIYIIEDDFYPIVDDIHVNSKGETPSIELNFGNYYLEYRIKKESTYFGYRKLFQVKAGESTHITIGL